MPAQDEREENGGEAAAPVPAEMKSMSSEHPVFDKTRRGDFTDAMSLLEESPALWREADAEGHTLLHWAALAGCVPMVQQGLSSGAVVDALAHNGQTPLMWCMIKGHAPAARMLLEAKADPHASDSMGATPFILALQHQQHSAVLMLISLEPRERLLGARDRNGCGPVHWAAYKGDLTSLKLLDYFDADFSRLDDTRMTPLHRAVEASMAGVCEFLLEKEVDPSQKDTQGRTCMDIATSNQDRAMKRQLDRLLEVGQTAGSITLGAPGAAPQDLEAPTGASLRRRDRAKDEAAKFKEKAMQNAAATFWLVSVSMALFEYLTDLRPVSWELAPRAALGFELGVPLCLALFFFVMMSDPGRVPPQAKSASGVEVLTKAFKSGEVPDFSRLCTTTWVLKGLRTKYCTRTGACVDEFDHFCGWLNVAIGKGNHRPFIILACTEVCTQFCHLYLCHAGACALVQVTGFSDWMFAVATLYPLLTLVVMVHTITAPGILMLALQHLRMIGLNLTTNEMINMVRYSHFWQETENASGQKRRTFRNPFNKGSVLKNCLDFWWMRRRGETGAGACCAGKPHSGCSVANR